jgi:hypothetical protein
MQTIVNTHSETVSNIGYALECLRDLGSVAEGSSDLESLMYYENDDEQLQNIDLAVGDLENLQEQLTERPAPDVTTQDIKILKELQNMLMDRFSDCNTFIYDDSFTNKIRTMEEASFYLSGYLLLEKIIKSFGLF